MNGRGRVLSAVAAAVLVFGCILRIAALVHNRSFWMDEVLIALSLRGKSFLHLLGPLDFLQTMPLPVAFALKASGKLFGGAEWAYRLPLLLASILVLVVAWRRLPGVIGRATAVLTLALLVVYQPLVNYGFELKQYGVDALVTILLVVATLRLLDRPDGASLRALTLGGAVALLVSQPSVFVLAGVGLALIADRPGRVRTLLVTGGCWVAVFLVLYFGLYHDVAAAPTMQRFWSDAMLRPGDGWPGRMANAAWALTGADNFPGLQVRLALPLVIIGWYGAWRRRGLPTLLLLTVPVCATLGASVVGAYPVAPRLVLFLCPLLLWAMAEAIVTIAGWFGDRAAPIVGVALAGALVLPAGFQVTGFAAAPPPIQPARELLPRMDPAVPVMIPFGGYAVWAYYAGATENQDQLLETVRLDFACRSERPRPLYCQDLSLQLHSPPRLVLVSLTPDSPRGQSDEAWSALQVRRLKATGSGNASLFVATQESDRSRGLIRMLIRDLEVAGIRVADSVGLGQSTLYRLHSP